MMNNTTALRVPSNNPSPRSEVIERHVPLAKSIVARLRLTYGLNASFDDLYSLGLTGLMQAADRFDPARGASFATYAYHRIRGAVLDGLRRDPDVRLVDPLRATSFNSAFRASGIAANDNGRASVPSETPRDEPRWGLADPSTTYLMSSD